MRIKNLPSIESMDGSQDALVIEQTDGSEDKSRKVSPAQIKQYVLGEIDEVPTEDSDNLVKSGGIFSTMGVPCIDPDTGKMYLKGGAAFDGNIDSTPTAGSNNAVSSGGTKTYVDALVGALSDQITFKTSGEWRWIELPNKFVFMWCNHDFGTLGNLVQEGQFYRTAVPRLDYPFTFASLPGVWVQKQKDGQGLIIGTGTGGTTSQTPDFTIARFTSGTMVYGCTLSFFVVGIKA